MSSVWLSEAMASSQRSIPVRCGGLLRVAWIACVNGAGPVVVDCKDVIGVRASRLHSGRAERHSRDGEPTDFRALPKKPFDVGGGDMPFNEVTIDRGGVARVECTRHSLNPLDRMHVVSGLGTDVQTRFAQVFFPLRAARACRRLVDVDIGQSISFCLFQAFGLFLLPVAFAVVVMLPLRRLLRFVLPGAGDDDREADSEEGCECDFRESSNHCVVSLLG